MDLTTPVLPNLTLRDPFMVASSHLTGNESALRSMAPLRPSALTLKSTSDKKGGDGRGSRQKLRLRDSRGRHFALFTDGPTTLELLDSPTTYELTRAAKRILPESLLGVSILEGEDYARLAAALDLNAYAYVEFNWKYSFRALSPESLARELNLLHEDLRAFLAAFGRLPILVKLPREAASLLDLPSLRQMLATIATADAALIVANSERLRVPPSCLDDPTSELTRGVIVGEHLFLDTYNIIRKLSELRAAGTPIPTVVATGGVLSIASVVDLLAAGAYAVQLCTCIDLRGPQIIAWLRDQLASIATPFGSVSALATAIREDQSAWLAAAAKARTFAVDEDRVVEEIFHNTRALFPRVAEALQLECDVEAPAAGAASGTVPPDLTFVLTTGNVAGILLALRCIREFKLSPQRLPSAADFGREITKSTFGYDFAILPESSLTYIAKQGGAIPENNRPSPIGVVGESVVELVGLTGETLESVRTVYHFAGQSARTALAQLLLASTSKPETIELTGPQLVPLLRFWRAQDGMLAKPPLSRIYGLILPPELRARWDALWSTSEPLVLVASGRLLTRENGRGLAAAVLHEVQAARRSILESPDDACVELRGEGFFEYLASLLRQR